MNVYKSIMQGLKEAIEYTNGNFSDAKVTQVTSEQKADTQKNQMKNSSDLYAILLLAHLCGSDTIKNVAWIPSHFHFINTHALGCYTGRFFDIKEDFLCHSITNQNGACMQLPKWNGIRLQKSALSMSMKATFATARKQKSYWMGK